MATNTQTALNKVTLSAATSFITFSSIPSTYTDLTIVISGSQLGGSGDFIGLQYNGDTASNYSNTYLLGNGTSASSGRAANYTNARFGAFYSDQDNAIIHIQNYSNTTTHKNALSRSNSVGNNTILMTNTWRSTAAITSIKVLIEANNFAVGTTFSLYGIKAWSDETTPKATGGYVYSDSTYWYHAFPFSSTFTPNQSLTCDYLVVAGGGGTYFSGAGAGGLRQGSSFGVTATPYTITVGGGGRYDANGSNSTFSTITATGGGKGVVAANGNSGGSGSGGGSVNTDPAATGGAGNAGSYSPVEGYAGGSAAATPSGAGVTQQNSGGGGGAGGIGGNGIAGSNATGGNGGIGATSTLINAIGAATNFGELVSSNYYFAGGGGGGGIYKGIGGAGGGGSALANADVDGKTNTGGGAGGATWGLTRNGNGGSGIVVIRYAK